MSDLSVEKAIELLSEAAQDPLIDQPRLQRNLLDIFVASKTTLGRCQRKLLSDLSDHAIKNLSNRSDSNE
jgi:hypothetical protein